MSIIGSPFDLSADIFTQKYAAQDDGQGQQGGQATNDFQSSGSYSTSCHTIELKASPRKKEYENSHYLI